MTTMTTTELLGATDRCDACGARASVIAVLTSGNELLFCAHHARKHHPALKPRTVGIHDETPGRR